MKRVIDPLFRALLFGAVLSLSLLAYAQSGSTVEIKSVDNYAGNSNVYTDKPNTTITVTELDADKKPVRSWTGTTDGDGKITIPAGSNLSKPYLRAVTADPKSAEFVTPSALEDGMPFTFASMGTVQGEVVTVQNLSGEVVARQEADDFGRMFLERGLPTGTYIISAARHDRTKIKTIKVTPRVYDAPSNRVRQIQFGNNATLVYVQDHVKLTGEGFNPDASKMEWTAHILPYIEQQNVQSSVRPWMPMLASTPREAIFACPADSGIKPGAMQFELRDKETGQSATTPPVVAYSAEAKLTQVKVPSGSETHLLIMVTPRILEGEASAQILSGPMSFSGGSNAMTMPVKDGQADFRLQSAPGSSGSFQVSWQFSPMQSITEMIEKLAVAGEGPTVLADIYKEPQDPKQAQQNKNIKAAEAAEKEAEAAEKAARDAEDKGDHEKAAQERKKAAAKRAEAAGHRRKAGDTEGAIEQEKKSAQNSRDEADNEDAKNKSQKPGKDARKRAAAAEQRAAADAEAQARKDAKTDKDKAAKGMDEAADAYDRAAKDYKANGEGSKASDMEKKADAARKSAEGLRK